jgi:hypothetical protein
MAAEFAPKGGETVYNAGRAVSKAPDLAESLYSRIMSSGRGNMGSQTGSIDPKLLMGGAGLGAGAYGVHKLMALLDKIKDPNSVVQQANPFGRAADILNKAGQ